MAAKHNKATIALSFWVKAQVEKALIHIVKKVADVKKNTLPQSVNIPLGTYSPWKADTEFQKTYNHIKSHTTVDIYRLYEIWKLLEQLKSVEGDILEVGVWRGGSGAMMAHKCQLEGMANATVWLADTFTGVVKTGANDNKYTGGEFADTTPETVQNLCNSLNAGNTQILRGIFPDDSAKAVEGRKFRLCHIDVDAYGSAKQVMEWVWPRINTGGVVVFDDYGLVGCEGVTLFVNEFIKTAPDALMVYNLNAHAVVIKTR